MNKLQVMIILLAALFLAVTGGFFLIGYLKPKGAGILIESSPASAVFINNEQVGRTPFEGTFRSGEVTVRLVPEASEVPLIPYETRVNLSGGIKTVIRRFFGETDEGASGEVISFEKTGSTEASLSIVSTPDAAQITLDGQPKGFTPIKLSRVTSGEHQLIVSAVGYKERIITIRAEEGFRLTVVVKLAVDLEAQKKEEDTKKMEPIKVLILETPTGFLRVREEPKVSAREVGQVKPGEEYPLIEKNEELSWYKILLEEGKEGWVTGEYATVSGEVAP